MDMVTAFAPWLSLRMSPTTTTTTTTTTLFLEQDIADMIDRELFRQRHKKEFDAWWMKQHKETLLRTSTSSSTTKAKDDLSNSLLLDDDARQSMRQYKKDQLLASQHPEQYCADRCLATGHCDVYEDIFDLTPQQVLDFCQDCVLSDGEEPCELPLSFYKDNQDEKDNHNDRGSRRLQP
ncbi:hypothetical protein ACA910_009962 [Epithemia clementina (nom. ined.)]